jgi:hypothetical protein
VGAAGGVGREGAPGERQWAQVVGERHGRRGKGETTLSDPEEWGQSESDI